VKPKHQVIDGLRRLSARQKPGEEFSAETIAKECGVSVQAIDQIEQKAMSSCSRLLRQPAHRAMLREFFPKSKLID